MIVAIVPAFNETKIIGGVVASLRPFVDKVIVVDDGSQDRTAERAQDAGAEVLTHLINRGQGAALETGRMAAILIGADIIITFDADGQFVAAEIPSLIAPIVAGECDVVLGSRFLFKKSNIPLLRHSVLKLAIIFTRLTTRLQLTDTHNGFRAFSRAAAERIKITQDRMAHASEILEQIATLGLKYKELPVTVNYTDYSRAKGQKSTDFLKILKDWFWGKLL
jgi:glycosyltransferase involved in cell wall biosynthesis